MKIGRKIFYDKVTGIRIVDTGQWDDVVRNKTVDEEISTYKELSERNRSTFDVIELPYGAHAQDFAECNGYRVNVETKELEFSLRDPNKPDAPQEFGPPLTKQIEELRMENSMNMLAMVEMFETNLKLEEDNANTMIAVTEMYELILGVK